MTLSLTQKVNEWLTSPFDTNTQETVRKLKEENPELLEESFHKDLEFGTGGMRGIMGVGTNRINKYTLGKSTQGLSSYLKEQYPTKKLKAVIAYDCRNNSDTLAQTVADVFSSNGIEVYLFSSLRTTPELSFAVKHLECDCGIVLTASHNPPAYNGYKVYWKDGGQLVPPQDKEIIERISTITYTDISFDGNKELIHIIDKEVDIPFIKAAVENSDFINEASTKENLSIVFTPLHGTSVTAIPEALNQSGFKTVHIVKEQEKPDGNFPTVVSPNPEEKEALKMALQLAEKTGADIVIGTDPDSDRLGIAIRDNQNKLTLLNGNQTMVVMLDFLLNQYQNTKGFDGNEFIASTIVSTPMVATLAASYGVHYKEVLTGFKWIAKLIKDHPELKFIGGGEESFGFMVGDFVRDKDAVTSTLLACQIAAYQKSKGSSFYQKLQELYQKHGYFKEHLVSLVKKGISGAKEIEDLMVSYREKGITQINGEKVVYKEDYLTQTTTNLQTGETKKIDLPKANVLIFKTEKNTKIAVRPSGTEPKIKFYISVQASLNDKMSDKEAEAVLNTQINDVLKALNL